MDVKIKNGGHPSNVRVGSLVLQEKQLLTSMHNLHISVPIPTQWAELSRNVSLHGPTYVKSLLSQRQHIVPDVQGATGSVGVSVDLETLLQHKYLPAYFQLNA